MDVDEVLRAIFWDSLEGDGVWAGVVWRTSGEVL